MDSIIEHWHKKGIHTKKDIYDKDDRFSEVFQKPENNNSHDDRDNGDDDGMHGAMVPVRPKR